MLLPAAHKEYTMPMLLKMMGSELKPDGDTTATYQLLSDVVSVQFTRDTTACYARVVFRGADMDEVFELNGNAYLMNEQGKTVSSFGSASLQPPT